MFCDVTFLCLFAVFIFVFVFFFVFFPISECDTNHLFADIFGFFFVVRMSWKDVISSHLRSRLPNETNSNLSTVDLANELVERGMIPEAIECNATLHEVLLLETLLKTLEGIEVPLAQRGAEELSAKEVLLWQMGRKSAERTEDLERETGLSLEYYHRLNSRRNVLRVPRVIKGKDDVKGLKVTEVLW